MPFSGFVSVATVVAARCSANRDGAGGTALTRRLALVRRLAFRLANHAACSRGVIFRMAAYSALHAGQPEHLGEWPASLANWCDI